MKEIFGLINESLIANSLTIIVNENVTHLTFAGPEIRSITSIEGLEKLKNLESLDFYNLTFINMDFFNSCKNLKELWIAGCTISSFSFIEKITELEKIELDLLKLFPKKYLKDVNHLFVYHGRKVCDSRSPKCDICTVKHLCKNYNSLKK